MAFEFRYSPVNANASMQIGFEGMKLRDQRNKEAEAKGRQNAFSQVLAQSIDPNTGELNAQNAFVELGRRGMGQEAMALRDSLTGNSLKQAQAQRYAAGGESPAGLQEFREFEKSTPERKKEWLEFKRGPSMLNLGGQLGVRAPGGGVAETYTVTPKPEQMPEFKGAQARAEAGAKADVERSTEATKKTTQAGNMSDLIGQADALLNDATGSYLGTAGALGKRAVGMSDTNTQANQQLKLISGWLVSNVPRMEGPQSNFDIQNYQEMAGKVGDTTVPVGDRRAALQQLLQLQKKYAGAVNAPASSVKTESKFSKVINGKRYIKIGPNQTDWVQE